jgi:hypothetical protein
VTARACQHAKDTGTFPDEISGSRVLRHARPVRSRNGPVGDAFDLDREIQGRSPLAIIDLVGMATSNFQAGGKFVPSHPTASSQPESLVSILRGRPTPRFGSCAKRYSASISFHHRLSKTSSPGRASLATGPCPNYVDDVRWREVGTRRPAPARGAWAVARCDVHELRTYPSPDAARRARSQSARRAPTDVPQRPTLALGPAPAPRHLAAHTRPAPPETIPSQRDQHPRT